MKKNSIKAVMYSSIIVDKTNNMFINELSMLSKLNILFEKKLLTKSEYDKIRSSFKFIA